MSARWQVEVVGWSAALVLVLGVGTVATGALDPVVTRGPAPVALADPTLETPVLVAPVAATRPTEGEIDPDLGPPPGPYPDAVPTRRAAPRDRYALLVGVQHYRAPTHPTIASVDDVLTIRGRLLAAGWLPQNIRVLTDEQATGAALRDGMAWLATKGQPGTFSLFHYSGHVKQFGGTTEALWPIDRDFVRDSEVRRALLRVGGKLWVDIAGCEAGSFLPGLPSDRVLFSGSSKGTEKSYENPAWGLSIWTGLVWGQRGPDADADRDGEVVIGEVLRSARYYAQLLTKLQQPHGRQTPQVEGDMVRGWTLASPPA